MLGTALSKSIDGLAEFLGRIGWLLVLYCMVFGVSDVFMRYVLNAPSQWIGTTTKLAMVLIACVGGAYALKHDAFVKLDLFYANFTTRKKAVMDLITAPFAFLFLYILIQEGLNAAMFSIKLNQMTPTAPPIPVYPIKAVIPVAAGIVAIIYAKKTILDLRTIFSGAPETDS